MEPIVTAKGNSIRVERDSEGRICTGWYEYSEALGVTLDEVVEALTLHYGTPVVWEYLSPGNNGRYVGRFCQRPVNDGVVRVLVVCEDGALREQLVQIAERAFRADVQIDRLECDYAGASQRVRSNFYTYALTGPISQVREPFFADQESLEDFVVRLGAKVVTFVPTKERAQLLRRQLIHFNPRYLQMLNRLKVREGEKLYTTIARELDPMLDNHLEEAQLPEGRLAVVALETLDVDAVVQLLMKK